MGRQQPSMQTFERTPDYILKKKINLVFKSYIN